MDVRQEICRSGQDTPHTRHTTHSTRVRSSLTTQPHINTQMHEIIATCLAGGFILHGPLSTIHESTSLLSCIPASLHTCTPRTHNTEQRTQMSSACCNGYKSPPATRTTHNTEDTPQHADAGNAATDTWMCESHQQIVDW